jgi:hypothetical protein
MQQRNYGFMHMITQFYIPNNLHLYYHHLIMLLQQLQLTYNILHIKVYPHVPITKILSFFARRVSFKTPFTIVLT